MTWLQVIIRCCGKGVEYLRRLVLMTTILKTLWRGIDKAINRRLDRVVDRAYPCLKNFSAIVV